MKNKTTFFLPRKKETLLNKGRLGGVSFYTEPEYLFDLNLLKSPKQN